MMKRIFAPALALLLVLALGGCYFFENPLTSSPSKDINSWLLGVWESVGDKGVVTRVTVLPLSSSRYIVWYRGPGKKPGSKVIAKFEGWNSRIAYTSFLNLHCLESNTPDVPIGMYSFLQYQVLTQNNVETREVVLDVSADLTSYQLRQEVQKRLKEKTLLRAVGTLWTRVSEVYWDPSEQEKQPQQRLRYPPQRAL